MPTAFITGANSFLGATLARHLLDNGFHVRGLVRPGSNDSLLQALPIERINGDLLQPQSWRQALRSCDALFHIAASYTHDPAQIPQMEAVNITGTRNVLEAALAAGVPKIIHTSTIGAIGQPQDGSLATEETPFNLTNPSAYVRSKWAGEQIARALAAQGGPIVIVYPTAMLGPGDWRPSNSGRIVLAFLHNRPLPYVAGGINWTPVQDVAAGMLLALEKGQPGRGYILGHAQGNLSESDFRRLMARASGQSTITSNITHWRQRLRRRMTGAAVQRGAMPQRLTCNPARAIAELGMPQSDLLAAARAEVAWYRQMGRF